MLENLIADSLYVPGHSLQIEGEEFITRLPAPHIDHSEIASVRNVVFRPELPVVPDKTLLIGLKVRADEAGRGFGLFLQQQLNGMPQLSVNVSNINRLTVNSDRPDNLIGADFYAEAGLTCKEMEVLFAVKTTGAELYINGYRAAISTYESYPTEDSPNLRLELPARTIMHLSSFFAGYGDVSRNWTVRPSRYMLDRKEADEHRLEDLNSSGRVYLSRDKEFEPYNPITFLYGKNDIQQLVPETRTFTGLQSDVIKLEEGDTVRTVLNTGEGRPEPEFMIFK